MPQRPRRLITSLRHYTGLLAVAVMNLAWWPAVGTKVRGVCTPGMNCHGCPAATGACPLGTLAYSSGIHAPSLATAASVATVGLASGRLVCGFACPFGWFQDLLFRIPGPKIRLPRWSRYGKYVMLFGFVLLLPWLLGIGSDGFISVDKPIVNSHPEGLELEVLVRNPSDEPVVGVELDAIYQGEGDEQVEAFHESFPEITVPPGEEVSLPLFVIPNYLEENDLVVTSPQSGIVPRPSRYFYFCKICPVGTLQATMPKLVESSTDGIYGAEGATLWTRMQTVRFRLAILGVVLLLMWMSSRAFCRIMCPLGAAYAVTTPLALSRIELDTSQCTFCQACSRVCPVDLDVPAEVGKAECIACGDCIRACPQQGLKRRFGW